MNATAGEIPREPEGVDASASAPIETQMTPEKLKEVQTKLQEGREQRASAELADNANDPEAKRAFQAADQAAVEAEFEKEGPPSDQALRALILTDYFDASQLDANQAEAFSQFLAAPGTSGEPIPADLRAELVEAFESAREVHKLEIKTNPDDIKQETETEAKNREERKDKMTYSEKQQARIDKYIENAKAGLFDRQLTDFLADRAKKAGEKPSPLDTAVLWIGTQLAQLLIPDDQPASKHLAGLVKAENYSKREALEASIGLHLVVNENTGDVFVDWREPSGSLPQIDRAFGLAKDLMGDGPAARLFDTGLAMDTTVVQLEEKLEDYPEEERAVLKKLLEGIKKEAGERAADTAIIPYLQTNSDALRVAIGLTPATPEPEEELAKEEPKENLEVAYEKAFLTATNAALSTPEEKSAFATLVEKIGKESLGDRYPASVEGVIPTFAILRLMGDPKDALKTIEAAAKGQPELAAKIAKIDSKPMQELLKEQEKATKKTAKDSPSTEPKAQV